MRLTVCHVEVEDCYPEGIIILVEDSFKFWTQECSTTVPALSTPRVEGATLEFDNRVWCVRALLLVKSVPVLLGMLDVA